MAVGLGFGQANEGKIFCDEVHDLPFVLNKFLPFTPLSTYCWREFMEVRHILKFDEMCIGILAISIFRYH